MSKQVVGLRVLAAGAMGVLVAVLGIACSSAPTPPPLTPDGPDMDPDAAVYQDEATPASSAAPL